jgi:hypothetical protein
MKGVLPWLMFAGLVVLVQEIYVLPWLLLLVDPVKNIFFLTVHYFNFVHIVQQAGQAVMLGRLSLRMRL